MPSGRGRSSQLRSIVRRNFVAQISHFCTSTRFGQTVAHLAKLLNQSVNLLLLSIHLCIELVEQVFAESGFYFQVDQAVFKGGIGVHGLYWT